jgi:hypothetical protein
MNTSDFQTNTFYFKFIISAKFSNGNLIWLGQEIGEMKLTLVNI